MARFAGRDVRVRQRKLLFLATAAALIGVTLLLIGHVAHPVFVVGAGFVGLAAGLATLSIALPMLARLP